MTPSEPTDLPVRQVRWADRTAVVDVAGEIDINTSPVFQQELLKLLHKRPQRIVINLSKVPYMDSSGVASLVKLLSRVRKGDLSLRLACLTDRVRGVFEITRLDTVFDIFDTEGEALA